jgi:hypothetical protein
MTTVQEDLDRIVLLPEGAQRVRDRLRDRTVPVAAQTH